MPLLMFQNDSNLISIIASVSLSDTHAITFLAKLTALITHSVFMLFGPLSAFLSVHVISQHGGPVSPWKDSGSQGPAVLFQPPGHGQHCWHPAWSPLWGHGEIWLEVIPSHGHGVIQEGQGWDRGLVCGWTTGQHASYRGLESLQVDWRSPTGKFPSGFLEALPLHQRLTYRTQSLSCGFMAHFLSNPQGWNKTVGKWGGGQLMVNQSPD